ncbi:hypothetical protein ABEV74_06580 [Paenibacillus cisolokensis]|jgi:hypothetical protein|uniref:Uncharacterized protein n=1 Tax=Paenibacillus cisolokensis TaxID=1658519 RepID=A0ABQ4N4H6_9BACL|nr:MULTISPECIES: hypothetical protein [Paenibacillus]ALS28979.1 hypothetical protein IJ21_35910 [Paenibacillus sp. 32O-W]GIQ63055.1 hypothetical protein PACILC2_16230 [Paenibacillus cisolokensis]
MGNYRFVWDERLGIPLPRLEAEWEAYDEDERKAIVEQWETIRGTIPERVLHLERIIVAKQSQLEEEEDFERSCRLNGEIAELASRIHDLHIWYRIDQEVEPRTHF